MKLYEIDSEIERILAQLVDPETGEITEETSAALDQLEMDRDAKALAVAAYCKGEKLESEAVKAEAARLQTRARRHQRRADALEGYIARHLPLGHKCRDARSEITWRRSTAVLVDDMDALPEDCVRVKVERSPDKKVLGERLKGGEEIKGARLEQRQNIQIR